MEFLRSVLSLLKGIVKRFWALVPTLVSDPFDFAEKLGWHYSPPLWLAWSLFGVGLFTATALTYHELWKRKEALKKPQNWIDAHYKKHGKLPELPKELLEAVGNYTPGNPISKQIKVRVASGQLWNRLLPSQRDQLLGLVQWLGDDPRDYVAKMENMLPKHQPKTAVWKPFSRH